MFLKDLIKLSIENNDKNFIKLKKFFEIYDTNSNYYDFTINNNIKYMNFYSKSNKKKIAFCKINKLFDFVNLYNVLYWEWANINTNYYNNDVKKIWEYGFNLINKSNKENYFKIHKCRDLS